MKQIRNISGLYFRAHRDGKYENVCFEDLALEEQENILLGADRKFLERLAIKLADVINELGEQFGITGFTMEGEE